MWSAKSSGFSAKAFCVNQDTEIPKVYSFKSRPPPPEATSLLWENKKTTPWRLILPSSACLCCGVLKKLQTPCAQMTKISRGLSRAWVCFPASSSVSWLVPSFPGSLTRCSAVLGARSPLSQPAPDLKRDIGSSSYPRLLNNPRWEGIILFMNGHVCLLECHCDAGYLWHQSALCMSIILHFLHSMECIGRSSDILMKAL